MGVAIRSVGRSQIARANSVPTCQQVGRWRCYVTIFSCTSRCIARGCGDCGGDGDGAGGGGGCQKIRRKRRSLPHPRAQRAVPRPWRETLGHVQVRFRLPILPITWYSLAIRLHERVLVADCGCVVHGVSFVCCAGWCQPRALDGMKFRYDVDRVVTKTMH